jgi:ubiquinone/menaquinone biosynthesis C-methylase UbiE
VNGGGPTPCRLELQTVIGKILNELDIDKPERILYVGIAGPTATEDDLTYLKTRPFKTLDCDPETHPDIVADICNTGLPSNSFDRIIMTSTIEHVWDFRAALAECLRILAPNGWLVMDCPWMYRYHPEPTFGDYWRISAPALDRLLEDVGFAEVHSEMKEIQSYAWARKEALPNWDQQATSSHGEQSGFATRAAARVKMLINFTAGDLCEDDLCVDFGGSDGMTAEKFRKITRNAMECYDGQADRVEWARERGVPARQGLMESLPYADGEVAWGYCSHTLEHTLNLTKSLRELSRVISQGLLVIVPLETYEMRRRELAHHNGDASVDWWAQKIENAGFTVGWRSDLDYNATSNPMMCEGLIMAYKPEVWAKIKARVEAMKAAQREEQDRLDDIKHAEWARMRARRVVANLPDEVATSSWVDFGGGYGDAADEIMKACVDADIRVLDINPDKLVIAKSVGIPVIESDAASTGLDDASYDWIYSSHMLEHVDDLGAVLREMYRVSSKGVYLVVPLQEDTPELRNLYVSHKRFLPAIEDWVRELTAAGFVIHHARIESYLNDLPEADIVALKPGVTIEA